MGYSPSDGAKIFDKPLNRKPNVRFEPRQVFDIIRKGPLKVDMSDEEKRVLIEAYLDFKALMLSIDPSDEDDEEAQELARIAQAKLAARNNVRAKKNKDTTNNNNNNEEEIEREPIILRASRSDMLNRS